MANWKTTVKIGDLHNSFEDGNLTIKEVGKEVADRLKRNNYADDCDLQDIIELLETEDYDVEGYDYILRMLYDYGDLYHRIWVDDFE